MCLLIPKPARLDEEHGVFAPTSGISVCLAPEADAGAHLALLELMTELRSIWQRPVYPTNQQKSATIRCAVKRRGGSETYELIVRKNCIEVIGHGFPGLFYGIQTLRQLVRAYGTHLPCCTIQDDPAFPNRAFYLDVSRGRVPRLETLRQLVNLLAHLKYNQLQLYVEHVFPFAFDPDISAGCDVLTPHELKSLDDYCRTRHIKLVPSLACFGHMGRILGLPAYRDLAEQPWPAPSWAESRWIDRLRGATINPRDPRSRKLLRSMLREFLPCFSAEFFNMCGDETYDLGRGANRNWVQRHGMAALYARHVRFLHDEAALHGKRLMLWGDMLLKYPDAIRLLPRDSIVLDWGYEPTTPFSKVRAFTEAGLEAYVCPSTRGYRVVFNEIETARANITGYAGEGWAAGASGLLVTDWGDMGHFNLPAASLHGLALGAGMAWNLRGYHGIEFERAFSLQLFGDVSNRIGRAFRLAGSAPAKQWPLMLTDLPHEWRGKAALEKAEKTLAAARESKAFFLDLRSTRLPSVLPAAAPSELLLACRAMKLTAEKILLLGGKRKPTMRARKKWADLLQTFFEDYASVWQQYYKPLGLTDLKKAFERAYRRVLGNRQPLTRLDLP